METASSQEPWSLSLTLWGARNLPKLDIGRLSDPYACMSVLSLGPGVSPDALINLQHNVSKIYTKEHETTVRRFKKKVEMKYLNPSRRTRVMKQTLEPRWAQAFQFRQARNVYIDEGTFSLQVAPMDVDVCGDDLNIFLLLTVHDKDRGKSDDFSGRCTLKIPKEANIEGEFPLLNPDGSDLKGANGEQAVVLLKATLAKCVYRDTPLTEKTLSVGQNEFFEYASGSMQGWRATMEDAHTCSLGFDGPSSLFAGVFDGHGGCDVSMFCERHLLSNVTNSERYEGDKIRALMEAFLRTDNDLLKEQGMRECAQLRVKESLTAGTCDHLTGILRGGLADEHTEEVSGAETAAQITECGATAVSCLIVGNELYCANAGDSRAVLCRRAHTSRCVAVNLSEDHKPGNERESRRILKSGHTIQEGRIDGRIAVSRSLGDFLFKNNTRLPPWQQAVTACPEVKKLLLEEGDEFMVLACDGIWEVLSSDALVERVHSGIAAGQPLQDIVSHLFDECLHMDPDQHQGVGCDNMTCILIRFKSAQA